MKGEYSTRSPVEVYCANMTWHIMTKKNNSEYSTMQLKLAVLLL